MASKLIKIVKYTVLFFISLYSLIWLLSDSVIRHYLNAYLAPHQIVLSTQTTIRYNPFLSHLSVQNLLATKTSTDQQTVLSLKALDLELSLPQLFFDQIYVEKFVVDGLVLQVNKLGDRLTIAGIVLPEPSKQEQQGADEDDQALTLPYKLVMPELSLKNAQIDLAVDGAEQQLKLNSLVVKDIDASLTAQSLHLIIDAKLNQSPLALDISLERHQEITQVLVDLALTQFDLARLQPLLPPAVSQLSGRVSYSAKIKINIKAGAIDLALQQLSISSENLALVHDNLQLNLAGHNFNSNDLTLALNHQGKLAIEGQAQLALNGFKVVNDPEHQTLAAFSEARLTDVVFSSENSETQIKIANFSLVQAAFSDLMRDDIAPLAQFSLLNVNRIQLTPRGIAIADLALSGLALDVQLDENQQLVNLINFAPKSAPHVDTTKQAADESLSQAPAQQSTAEPEQPAFSFSLGEFTLADNATINFNDPSVQPAYKRQFKLTKLRSSSIDTQTPEKPINFDLKGTSDEYAHFAFAGSATPLAAMPNYQVKGAFKEVSLPGISSYIKQALDYEIKSGQLDLALDIAIKGPLIEGNADVLLRGIELTAADDHQADSVKDQALVPFNMALDMLKDSDGNVELSLPLSGDSSSPTFGLSGFMTLLVKQATMSAARTYLITTFVPYANVVNIALAAGEFALKVRFNDLHYAPGEIALQGQHQAFLTQFSALMKDKSELQIKLCAVATAADIGKAATSQISEIADIEKLTAISQQRVSLFKKHMVEVEKVDSSRLLLCTPQIDVAADAQAAISFVQ